MSMRSAAVERLRYRGHNYLFGSTKMMRWLGPIFALAALPMRVDAVCGGHGFCTRFGNNALVNNTTGIRNTAIGDSALSSNTTGGDNTASGYYALFSNTIGNRNTAVGNRALTANNTGAGNVAIGSGALSSNATGIGNIALGQNAGSRQSNGIRNIHIGNPGFVGETKVIRIGVQGTQLKTYIAGISGATVTGGAAVVVDSNGQLGVVSSSRRFKENIKPMTEMSAELMKLNPVTFTYRGAGEDQDKPVQFGLIAEEVAEVLPNLVVRDKQGRVETVAYHLLPILLLKEYQEQQGALANIESRNRRETARLRDALAVRDSEIAALRAEMKLLRDVTEHLLASVPNSTTVGLKGK